VAEPPRPAADPVAARRGGRLRARRAAAVALAGAGLVLIAFVFNASPLFVPGIALAAIGVLTPGWVLLGARGAHVRRRLGAERVVEGEPLRATIEVRRRFTLGGWGGVEAVDALSGERLRLGGARSPIRHARAARVQVTVRLPRRGEHRIEPPALVVSDPLELAELWAPGDGDGQTVLVLPRTEPVRWLGGARTVGPAAALGDAASEALAATDLEGLRPYRPGTPASRIHWPAVARGRGLIERRLQADGDRRPLVVLDARRRQTGGPGAAERRAGEEAALDAAVRAAASLVLELARTGGCGLLMSGLARPMAIDPELAGWPAAQARLAVVGTPADPADADRRRPPALGPAGGRGGPLIYVAAASHERLVTGLSGAAGRGPVLFVVPESELVEGRPRGAGARARPALAVSGCRGFVLGARRAAGDPAGAAAGAGRR
jgi:uncharacterized protein (DUF58 family)